MTKTAAVAVTVTCLVLAPNAALCRQGLAGLAPPPTSIRLTDQMKAQVQRCWVPTSAIVTVSFYLNRDGSIADSPKPAIEGAASDADAKAVLKAIADCAPYKMPVERYEEWQSIELRFAAAPLQ